MASIHACATHRRDSHAYTLPGSSSLRASPAGCRCCLPCWTAAQTRRYGKERQGRVKGRGRGRRRDEREGKRGRVGRAALSSSDNAMHVITGSGGCDGSQQNSAVADSRLHHTATPHIQRSACGATFLTAFLASPAAAASLVRMEDALAHYGVACHTGHHAQSSCRARTQSPGADTVEPSYGSKHHRDLGVTCKHNNRWSGRQERGKRIAQRPQTRGVGRKTQRYPPRHCRRSD